MAFRAARGAAGFGGTGAGFELAAEVEGEAELHVGKEDQAFDLAG